MTLGRRFSPVASPLTPAQNDLKEPVNPSGRAFLDSPKGYTGGMPGRSSTASRPDLNQAVSRIASTATQPQVDLEPVSFRKNPAAVALGKLGGKMEPAPMPSWKTFVPCLDILPPAQRDLWPQLREASRMGFVLYGGTAIALRLGHRQSMDFDFFTERPFDQDRLIQRLEKKDYLDVHAMVTQGYRLEDGLAGARALFGRSFQPAEALKALTWFKGGGSSGAAREGPEGPHCRRGAGWGLITDSGGSKESRRR